MESTFERLSTTKVSRRNAAHGAGKHSTETTIRSPGSLKAGNKSVTKSKYTAMRVTWVGQPAEQGQHAGLPTSIGAHHIQRHGEGLFHEPSVTLRSVAYAVAVDLTAEKEDPPSDRRASRMATLAHCS